VTAAVWQCGVCEGINPGGTTCATCGAVIPPGAAPPPPPSPPVRPARTEADDGAGSAPASTRSRSGPGTLPDRPGAARPVRLPSPSSVRGDAASSPPRRVPPPTPDVLLEDLLAELLRPYDGKPYPPPARARRPSPRRPSTRPPAAPIGLLGLLMVLLGWAYALSYIPGVAPRTVGDAADQLLPLPRRARRHPAGLRGAARSASLPTARTPWFCSTTPQLLPLLASRVCHPGPPASPRQQVPLPSPRRRQLDRPRRPVPARPACPPVRRPEQQDPSSHLRPEGSGWF
jgi:hypothetical protein